MSIVQVTCRNFVSPYTKTNGNHLRNVSRLALLRAIITLGAQRYSDVFSLGVRSLRYRFGIWNSVDSHLVQTADGLCLHHSFKALDGSEQRPLTYWYGMAMAKIVADTELGIPWLAHVDRMRESGALATSTTSNRRGDLVGKGKNSDWHVIEAKGRSNPYPRSLITSAKDQSSNIKYINGQQPETCSACITALHTRPISILLEDPPPIDAGEDEHWQIDASAFFEQYYRGIVAYLKKFGTRESLSNGNSLFVTAPLTPMISEYRDYPPMRYLADWRLEIGLLKTIYDHPEQALDAVAGTALVESGKMGSDGIAIFGSVPKWEEIE